MRDRLVDTLQRLRQQPYRLWSRQVWAVAKLDLKRSLLSRRGWWGYALALAPVAIFAIHAILDVGKDRIQDDTEVLAAIFQVYYLRLAIFFGTLGIFVRLLRGEMVQRSLHYYLLAPVRREVLLLGKFLEGAVSSVVLFSLAVTACFGLAYLHHGEEGLQFIIDGPGFGQLELYLLATVLACMGYGAVFLLLGMLLKNPAPAALLFMGWEAINPVLPPIFQKISVASYIRHLLPVSVPMNGILALLTVVTEPVQPWVAVVGVLIFTAIVLAISCRLMRRLEINYTTE